jgi:hypothetical protein
VRAFSLFFLVYIRQKLKELCVLEDQFCKRNKTMPPIQILKNEKYENESSETNEKHGFQNYNKFLHFT